MEKMVVACGLDVVGLNGSLSCEKIICLHEMTKTENE